MQSRLAMASSATADVSVDGCADIDIKRNRYPYCIVWGSLPIITWLIPFIGHMGICDSTGRIHDFAGPYYIGTDDFMTGPVLKYWRLDPYRMPGITKNDQTAQAFWDSSIEKGDEDFSKMMHNICCNNCHHHTARCVNYMGLDWSMLKLFFVFTFKSRYVSWCRLLYTYAPFLFIVCTVTVLCILLG